LKIKKERIIEILILLFVLAAGIFTVYGIYYKTVVKPNLYTIKFHDIDSIIKGSPVRFMGIIVGHVRNLKRADDAVYCEIVVTKPHTKIPDGAVAKVEFNGLAGSKSVEIMPPKTENPQIKGIVTAEALRLSDVMDMFSNLREVMICIKEFVDGITPESALGTAKAIAEAGDFTVEADKALDEMAKKEKEVSKKFRTVSTLETVIDNILSAFRHGSRGTEKL